MAQHDYNVANAPGATVRADINSLAEAIASLNSGATAPSVTFPNMFWADTNTNLLKLRNNANSAWLTVGAISGSTFTYMGATIAIAQGGTGATTAPAAQDLLNSTGYIDVASGSTTNIGAAASQKVNITGSNAISAFDSVSAGIVRTIRFNADVTLTYNATSMQLPGGVTINAKAGDQAVAVSLGSGNWRISSYTPYIAPWGSYRYVGTTFVTATGTFNWAASTRLLKIRAVAPGGGGGGAKSNDGDSAAGAGGGAAGQYFEGEVTIAALITAGLSALAVTINAVGAGGVNTGGNGSVGGDLVITALLTIKGGNGGNGLATSLYNGAEGASKTTGGSITSPLAGLIFDGAPGMNGAGSDQTADNYAQSGNGGPSPLGGGGRGRFGRGNLSLAGEAGAGYGSGGGAAASSNNSAGAVGGNGAAGLLIIEEYA